MAIVGDKVKLSNYSYQLNPDGTDFDQSLIDKIETDDLRRPNEKVLDAVDIDWRPYKVMDYSDENNPTTLYAPGELKDTSQIVELLAYAYSASKQALHADKSDEADHAYISSYVSHIEINHLGLSENKISSGQLLAVNSLQWNDTTCQLSYNTTYIVGKNFSDELLGTGEIFNDYVNNQASHFSHAEGESTSADGYASHAEGSSTIAEGGASHAEGISTVAIGNSSHTEGQYTLANNEAEHASGILNNSISYIESDDSVDAHDDVLYDDDLDFSTDIDSACFYNTIFTVGNGESLQTGDIRHNAFEVRRSGDIYIPDVHKPGEYYQKPMIHLQRELANKADHDEVNNIIGLKDAFRFAGAFTPTNTNSNNKPTSETAIIGTWQANEAESVYKRIVKWENIDNKEKEVEIEQDLTINEFNVYKVIVNDKTINNVEFFNLGDTVFSFSSDDLLITYAYDNSTLTIEYSEDILNFSLFIKDSKTGEVWKVTKDGWFGNKFIHAGDMLLSYSDKATQDNTEYWVVIESHISYLNNSGAVGGFSTTNIKESDNNNLYLDKFVSNINISDDGKLSYTYSNILFTQKSDSDFITSLTGNVTNGSPTIQLNSSKFVTAYTASTLESLNAYLTVVSSLEFDKDTKGKLNYTKTDIPVELLESVWEKGENNGAQLKYGNNTAVSYSVAGGENSSATGKDSLAIGTNVTSVNDSEASLGKFNYTNRTVASTNDKTLFTVGNGILNNLHNALEIRNSGDIYIADTEVESGEYYQKPMILLQEALTRTKIQKVTWEELVDLKNNSKLKPGSYYQITDYASRQYNIRYIYPENTEKSSFVFSGNQFDIIVLATSNNTLSEDAKAEYHSQSSSDYFFSKNCKLHSWKLKYCLENDTERFAWANTSYGNGVIYQMIDEHNNEAPYDFKNILMWRYYVQPTYNFRDILGDFTGKFLGIFPIAQYGLERVGVTSNPNAGYAIKYTFNNGDTQISINTDCSVYPEYNVCNNIIKPYYYEGKQYLNDITFDCSITDIDNSCHNNVINENCIWLAFGENCFDNTINTDCNSMTFGDNVCGNSFGSKCYQITLSSKSEANSFGQSCYNILSNEHIYGNIIHNCCWEIHFGGKVKENIFEQGCYKIYPGGLSTKNSFGVESNNITLGDECHSNTFGNNCVSIILGSYNHSNTFNNECYQIELGSQCESNSLNNKCSYITLGNTCVGNSFGNICHQIALGDNCLFNSFGNSCTHIVFGKFVNLTNSSFTYTQPTNNCTDISIDDGVSYIALNSDFTTSVSYLKNIHVLRGVHGGSILGKIISVSSTNPKLNVSFSANELQKDYELLIGMNSKGRLCKWINEPFGATVTLVSGGNRNIADIPANII